MLGYLLTICLNINLASFLFLYQIVLNVFCTWKYWVLFIQRSWWRGSWYLLPWERYLVWSDRTVSLLAKGFKPGVFIPLRGMEANMWGTVLDLMKFVYLWIILSAFIFQKCAGWLASSFVRNWTLMTCQCIVNNWGLIWCNDWTETTNISLIVSQPANCSLYIYNLQELWKTRNAFDFLVHSIPS